MPNSCLLVFSHSERKRQINPFQIGTFHYCCFFSSLPWRFKVSSLPASFPKQACLYGLLISLKRLFPGRHDFVSVSRFAFLVCSPNTHDYALGALGRLVLHLTKRVSHLSPTHLHDSAFVSHLSDSCVDVGIYVVAM